MRRAFKAAFAAAFFFFLSCLGASDAVMIHQVPPAPQSTKDALRIARNAYRIAMKMQSNGRCMRGVKIALKDYGVTIRGVAAHTAAPQLMKDSRFKLVHAKKISDLRKGDILVNGAVPSHPYGHIAVYVGNELEASDHIQQVVFNSRTFGKTTVFRLRD